VGREGVEQGADALPCCFVRSLGGLTEHVLELGKDLLDRVEVRAVGRQEEQVSARGADGLPDGFTLVAAEIVEDDDVARPEGWDQELLDVSQEAAAVDGTIEDSGRVDTVVPERSQEGQRLPVAVGHLGAQPLTPATTAVGAGHIGLGPSLIDEDKAPGIKPSLIAPPARAAARDDPSILLGWQHAFF